MIRRFGTPPETGRRYRRRAGVYAVLLRRDAVLLTRQSDPLPEFQLPGGGIDAGEQPLAALHREVREEAGWLLVNPRHIGTFRRFTFMPDYNLWAEKVCTVFVARPTLRLGRPTDGDHDAVWVAARDAPDLLGNAGDRSMLMAVLRRRRLL